MLTDDERSELDSLLELNADLFALTRPATPHAKHQIDTGNHAPIAGPPYRVSPAKQRLLRSEVDYLLSEDIIEECESPWASPEVLVPKPDGSQRLWIDYRKLNAITRPDVCPLPRVEELLHSTGNAKYITTLDLWSGYYQIKMYKVGIGGNQVLVYLDDLIILSATVSPHLADLKSCFDRMRQFKLRMNRSKCHFGCLETCNWYRRFIPKFAEITRPLTSLTKKDAAWDCGSS
ncbi:hypothetical protein GEV33_001576 [Tenebrio molitor]|uniref:Reverse transcriptase domain-containing protein n=1 Tax=Tenebrio molitor TaxID=7067 RepID=A0A8J6HM09_TENMO|nr:hypothetical protein GEV33_001576 [Tenebrio molitor]